MALVALGRNTFRRFSEFECGEGRRPLQGRRAPFFVCLWRSHDLQPDRRQGLLSGSCEADLYGRHEAHCGPTVIGRQRTGSFAVRTAKPDIQLGVGIVVMLTLLRRSLFSYLTAAVRTGSGQSPGR